MVGATASIKDLQRIDGSGSRPFEGSWAPHQRPFSHSARDMAFLQNAMFHKRKCHGAKTSVLPLPLPPLPFMPKGGLARSVLSSRDIDGTQLVQWAAPSLAVRTVISDYPCPSERKMSRVVAYPGRRIGRVASPLIISNEVCCHASDRRVGIGGAVSSGLHASRTPLAVGVKTSPRFDAG